MDVSIIVVAWNVKKLLYDCLKSVYDQTRDIDFEVIYVDNASEDGSVEMVKEAFPEVRIIQNDENMGFIIANNQGIEQAKGRYVLLLNSDTIVLDNAVGKALKFADEHPEAAAVGCKLLNPDMTLQRNCFMYPSIINKFLSATYLYKVFPRSKFFGRERMTWWDFDEPREVETVSGCFSMVRQEAIKEVGLMDKAYFVYGDDPDWCYRFKKAGWKILFTPEAQIIHFGGQTTKLMARKFRLQLIGSQLIFMRIHRSRAAFYIACFLTSLFCFFRSPYWLLKSVFSRANAKEYFDASVTCLIGAFYCLFNWKGTLMNKKALEGKL